MRCEHCGTENVDGARFCKGCGADLTQQNEAANQPAWGSNMNNTKTAPNQNYSNITPSQVGDMIISRFPCGDILDMNYYLQFHALDLSCCWYFPLAEQRM